MKILVFGAANIDRRYSVEHFAKAGETLTADEMNLFCGGKGLNQAIAFARAGSEVYFAGAVGEDGGLLKDTLTENGVNIDHMKTVAGPSGHAVIQVTPDGQNSIIYHSGSNAAITREDADRVLSAFSAGDMIVLQNEISNVDYILKRAKERGMTVALNPSPFNEKITRCDLSKTDYLLINEVEGASLTGKNDSISILASVRSLYPRTNIILTLGDSGSMFAGADGTVLSCGIYKTRTVDTTAAGDTYTGYFLSDLTTSQDIKKALKTASVASGLSVSRHGASHSIPFKDEVSRASDSSFAPEAALLFV